MVSDAEHFSINLLAICISFEKYSFRSFAQFWPCRWVGSLICPASALFSDAVCRHSVLSVGVSALLPEPLPGQAFTSTQSHLSDFTFCGLRLWSPVLWVFSPLFSPSILQFPGLYLSLSSTLNWFFYVVEIRIQIYSSACAYPVSQMPLTGETVLSPCVFLACVWNPLSVRRSLLVGRVGLYLSFRLSCLFLCQWHVVLITKRFIINCILKSRSVPSRALFFLKIS